MRRIRFFIDLGLGRTHAEHFDFPDDGNDAMIQLMFNDWIKALNQGWEPMEDVPSIYKQEVNNDPRTSPTLLQSDTTEQSASLGQQGEMYSASAELHEVPSRSET